MFCHYEPDATPGFAAISRAVDQATDRPPAREQLFSRSTRCVGVDWERARQCHRSNELLVAAIGGMLDAAVTEAVLRPACNLALVVSSVSSLDEPQQLIFLAAAGDGGAPRSREGFVHALNALIELEGLHSYFKCGPRAATDHYDIRPRGEAGDSGGTLGVFKGIKARAKHLPRGQRIPLIATCSIYNGSCARDVFKGRGWAFNGAELGRWLSERFESNERSASAMLRAIGHYCGW